MKELPPLRKLTKDENANLFSCLGADNLCHHRISWESNCICGMVIKKGKTRKNGRTTYDFNCYDCGCIVDGHYWGA